MNDINAKSVLITGATSGVGREIARLFRLNGAKLMLTDISREKLEELTTELGGPDENLFWLCSDMADDSHADVALEETYRKFGSLDILINNASIMDNFSPVHETGNQLWNRVMQVNINASFYLCRGAVQFFLKQGYGNIINISSICGLFGGRAGAAFTASQHALIGLTKNIGYDYAEKNIRCNAIAPGVIEEGITWSAVPNSLGLKRAAAGAGNSPRKGSPEEIAGIALFLSSARSSLINGSVITADGGWTAY